MRVIVLRDYPDSLGETIERCLHTDYTLTGYYGDSGLEWVLQYVGDRDTTLVEIALSEYILDSATVNTVYNIDSHDRLKHLRSGKSI
jgi:hypothetical protein